MLEKNISPAQLDFLESFDIGIKNNKLINLISGKEFYPIKQNMNRYGLYYYSCGDAIVEFSVVNDVSRSVTIFNGNYEFRAWEGKNGERGVNINRLDARIKTGISIFAQPKEDFIKTAFDYEKEPALDFKGTEYIDTTFTNIYREDNHKNYGGVLVDNYRAALTDMIKDLYADPFVQNMYLKCRSFIFNGFSNLLSYPVYNREKFIENFNKEIDIINSRFAEDVTKIADDNEYETRDVRSTMRENALTYVEEAIDFELKVKDKIAERQKRIESVKRQINDLDRYIGYYNSLKKVERKRRK